MCGRNGRRGHRGVARGSVGRERRGRRRCDTALRSSFIQYLFFSSRRRHTRFDCDWEFRRVLFRSSVYYSAGNVGVGTTSPGVKLQVNGTTVSGITAGTPGDYNGRSLMVTTRPLNDGVADIGFRSEERRVGEEGRSRWSPDHLKKKK